MLRGTFIYLWHVMITTFYDFTSPPHHFPVPTSAPANFTASRHAERADSIVLRWTAIAPEHRNGILLGYVVTVVRGQSNSEGEQRSAEGVQELEVEPNLVSFVIEGLVPDTQYSIAISARTGVGRGPVARAHVMLLPRGKLDVVLKTVLCWLSYLGAFHVCATLEGLC